MNNTPALCLLRPNWAPPIKGALKINFDAIDKEGKTTTGVVLRKKKWCNFRSLDQSLRTLQCLL